MIHHIRSSFSVMVAPQWVWLFLLALGGGLRLYSCFQLPCYTTDLLRNLGYGIGFQEWGFQVYDLTPFDFSPLGSQFLWENHHYTYPAVTLLFYGLLASIWASVFFGKLVFTLLDTLTAWLIYKTTEDRACALLYWLNPASLWFSSREGQFEGMVVLWMVLALLALKHKKPAAYGFLGLAIQAKLFPVFLAPYFLWQMAWREPRRLARQWLCGVASFLPTVWAQYRSGYLTHLLGSGYVPQYSPIHWLVREPAFYPYAPYGLVLSHFFFSAVFVVAALWGMRRTGRIMEFFPAVAYLVFIKMIPLGQFWYLILVPAFCLTIQDRAWRRIMMSLAALLCVKSIYSLLIGPIDYCNPPDAMYLLEICFWGM